MSTQEAHKRRRAGLAFFPMFLVALMAAGGINAGCLVDSQCQADYDCAEGERCNLSTGQCAVECVSDDDCWLGGVDLGKKCVDHRCEFLFDERVAAPKFCMEVINPESDYHGQDLCLQDLQGKVVLLFFGLLA